MQGYAVMKTNGEFEVRLHKLPIYKKLDSCYRYNCNIDGNCRFFLVNTDVTIKFNDNVVSYYSYKYSIIRELSYDDILDYFRDNKYTVNWGLISFNQKLTENFIREFKDYVNWLNISRCQTLSDNFKKEFEPYLKCIPDCIF